MLTRNRELTLIEIDKQLQGIHRDMSEVMNPMQRIKVERLKSERDWIVEHTPGLDRDRAS